MKRVEGGVFDSGCGGAGGDGEESLVCWLAVGGGGADAVGLGMVVIVDVEALVVVVVVVEDVLAHAGGYQHV